MTEEEIIGFVFGMFALELPLEIDKLNEEIKDGIYINRNIETVPEGKKAIGDSITIINKGADFKETATGTVFRVQHFEAVIKLETNSPEINLMEIRTKQAILNLLDAYKDFKQRYFRLVPVSMTKKAVTFDVVGLKRESNCFKSESVHVPFKTFSWKMKHECLSPNWTT